MHVAWCFKPNYFFDDEDICFQSVQHQTNPTIENITNKSISKLQQLPYPGRYINYSPISVSRSKGSTIYSHYNCINKRILAIYAHNLNTGVLKCKCKMKLLLNAKYIKMQVAGCFNPNNGIDNEDICFPRVQHKTNPTTENITKNPTPSNNNYLLPRCSIILMIHTYLSIGQEARPLRRGQSDKAR